jgi:phenylacetic acid degradation operon negative regulatory protein
MSRAERRGRERALRMLGFRTLRAGLDVRPDNLRQALDELRGDLAALGLPAADMAFGMRGLDGPAEQVARALWNAAELRAGYRRLTAQLQRSARQLERVSPTEAMVESFLVGGNAIRHLVLDPLLPDAICPTADRQLLIEALRRYDRLGRAAWAAFLRRFDVPHLRSPVDIRLGATPALYRQAEEGPT